jgi:GNAT superfamily N-acetyltransferase
MSMMRVYGGRACAAACRFGCMSVRHAGRADLLAIGRVAEASHWDTYTGLLKPDTIGRILQRDSSPAARGPRLLMGGVVVAEEAGSVVGFADADAGATSIRLLAIATDPLHRRGGVAATMLAAIRERHPELPVCADVLLGNLAGERFYEALGFAPGEILERRLFDEDVVERRWWLAPSP